MYLKEVLINCSLMLVLRKNAVGFWGVGPWLSKSYVRLGGLAYPQTDDGLVLSGPSMILHWFQVVLVVFKPMIGQFR